MNMINNKGTLWQGSTGKGKTTSMRKAFNDSTVKAKKYVHSLDIQMDLLDSTKGINSLREIIKWEELYIDDLGKEPTTVKFFGSEIQAMQYIIEKRYDTLYTDTSKNYKTFITTNLTDEELVAKYGAATTRRIFELCNIVEI